MEFIKAAQTNIEAYLHVNLRYLRYLRLNTLLVSS